MDMATIKANGAFYRSIFVISHGCVQLVCMVKALNNQCQCYPRRQLVPVNWRHTTSVWHLSSAAQRSFRVDKKMHSLCKHVVQGVLQKMFLHTIELSSHSSNRNELMLQRIYPQHTVCCQSEPFILFLHEFELFCPSFNFLARLV